VFAGRFLWGGAARHLGLHSLQVPPAIFELRHLRLLLLALPLLFRLVFSALLAAFALLVAAAAAAAVI
jgi:hypothetical protein